MPSNDSQKPVHDRVRSMPYARRTDSLTAGPNRGSSTIPYETNEASSRSQEVAQANTGLAAAAVEPDERPVPPPSDSPPTEPFIASLDSLANKIADYQQEAATEESKPSTSAAAVVEFESITDYDALLKSLSYSDGSPAAISRGSPYPAPSAAALGTGGVPSKIIITSSSTASLGGVTKKQSKRIVLESHHRVLDVSNEAYSTISTPSPARRDEVPKK